MRGRRLAPGTTHNTPLTSLSWSFPKDKRTKLPFFKGAANKETAKPIHCANTLLLFFNLVVPLPLMPFVVISACTM
jgi:hypothetical protein